jgi:predicted ATP-grasp superfamily ATP-dependent carboligase
VKGRVLVAGFATRHVAQSAYRAGWEVCAVDHFCDQDLSWYTKDREKFSELEDLPDAIERISTRHRFDLFVPTSGAELLSPSIPLCGTPPDRIARFLDKLDIQQFFESLDVPVPRILTDGKYPAMIKPLTGAGGWRNAVISSEAEMAAWKCLYGDVPLIRQEVVGGIPASVCCIATGSRAMAVTTNEQILRGSGESAFGFSGSLTPFHHPLCGEMTTIAERIAAASGCRGTLGIDFVVSDDRAVAIEVNPRFQGTVDTVEIACGCNMFDLHAGACSGNLPTRRHEPREVATRSIVFADRDMTVKADLGVLKEFVADIPWPGTFLEKNQAIVSVFGRGQTRDAALALLDKHISTVRQYMR